MWSVGVCLCLCLVLVFFSGEKAEQNISVSSSRHFSVLKNMTSVVELNGIISDKGYFNGTISNSLTRLQQQHSGSFNNNTVFLMIVVAVSALILLGFAIILTLCYLRRRKNRDTVLFEGCDKDVFDLDLLINAPTETLGDGTFGKTFRVFLENGTSVAFKRLKGSWRRKSDFKVHMEIVRVIKHENLVDLKAFYFSKTESFVVYDYFEESSRVSSLLHGNNGQNRIHLDWKTRMLIAIGATKGIARIHQENKESMVHGNIKSSNIFLNSQRQGFVSEFGIAAVMSPLTPPMALETGYCAPEITDTSKSTQLADVYSFGVVLLKLLTGRPAVQTSTRTGSSSLVQWVQMAAKTEWTTDLLDPNLQRCVNIEVQLLKLLKIAISCVETAPNQRTKMSELVPLMEEILHESEQFVSP